MKASITIKGILQLEAETESEAYALSQWANAGEGDSGKPSMIDVCLRPVGAPWGYGERRKDVIHMHSNKTVEAPSCQKPQPSTFPSPPPAPGPRRVESTPDKINE